MANTVSAKKMTRKIGKRTEINRSRRSRMRTFLRKVEEAIASGNQSAATEALRA
jgi:small subunit ribosomal protein S20